MLKMQLNRRWLGLYNKTLISLYPHIQNAKLNCSTNVPKQDDGGNGKAEKKKESLYKRITPLGSPKIRLDEVLDQWVQEGRKVSFAHFQSIIRDLRKCGRYGQALQD